jgi:hypothetical protein
MIPRPSARPRLHSASTVRARSSGHYHNNSGYHGFLYSGGSYIPIDDPFATDGTFAYGINDTGQIVGYYLDNTALRLWNGFLYNPNGGTYTSAFRALARQGHPQGGTSIGPDFPGHRRLKYITAGSAVRQPFAPAVNLLEPRAADLVGWLQQLLGDPPNLGLVLADPILGAGAACCLEPSPLKGVEAFPQSHSRGNKTSQQRALALLTSGAEPGALDRVAQIAERKYCRPYARLGRLGLTRVVAVLPVRPLAAR